MEPVRHADAALVQAAIALCDAATADARGRFYALARRGRPHADADVGHQVDLVHRGASYRMNVGQTGPEPLPDRGRRRPHRRGGRAGLRARAPAALRRPLPPDHDRAPGPRPARRGRRRSAPDLARRGRSGPQPRPGRRRRGPGRRRRRGARGRRRRGHREHEDGAVAHRAGRRPRARGAGVAERPRPRGRPLLRIEPIDDSPAAAAGERTRFDDAEAAAEWPGAADLARAGLRRPRRRRAPRRRRPARRAARTARASAGCSRSTPTCVR